MRTRSRSVTIIAQPPEPGPRTDQLKMVLGAVAEGIVLCDASGAIVYENQAVARFIELSPAGALAQEVVQRLLRSALGGADDSETIAFHGPPRQILSVTSRRLESAGEVLGAVAVIEDVTEKRRLEAIRRDFVANITHELKTPVGALALLAETLAGENDPETINRLADRIQGEAQRVARIMDDLLDLSRIESEEPASREPLSPYFVVTEAAERVRSAADQRGVAVHISELPSEPLLLGDRRQLVSAVYNLLENAVKYSDPGSSVEVDGELDGGMMALHVRDHGIGIARSELDRIFERFYRVDRARARDTGGTGLGLAIVRHVATNHGGTVSVRSMEGEGSTFTLRFPVA